MTGNLFPCHLGYFTHLTVFVARYTVIQIDVCVMKCQMVIGSIPDEVTGFSIDLILPAAYGPGVTQSLTEMSTRILPGGKGRLEHKTDDLTAIYELSRKCGSLNVSQLYGSPWPVTGYLRVYLLFIYYHSPLFLTEIWTVESCLLDSAHADPCIV
jgi:hypothetical protein